MSYHWFCDVGVIVHAAVVFVVFVIILDICNKLPMLSDVFIMLLVLLLMFFLAHTVNLLEEYSLTCRQDFKFYSSISTCSSPDEVNRAPPPFPPIFGKYSNIFLDLFDRLFLGLCPPSKFSQYSTVKVICQNLSAG